jgi:ribosome-associated translation inhibitor RaiA
MQTPLRITFRHMTSSAALESRIREHVDHLERLHSQLTGCEVVVTAPAEHHQQGAVFDVRINVTMPERHLHVRNGGANPAHGDAHVAVRDSFDVLERMMRRHLHALHRHRDKDSIRHGAAQPR